MGTYRLVPETLLFPPICQARPTFLQISERMFSLTLCAADKASLFLRSLV